MKSIVYLDYNATAPVFPEVLDARRELERVALNPSSIHAYGRKAKQWLESSRNTIAQRINAFNDEVIFTATGTESNHLALRGVEADRVLVSAVEHSSVLKAVERPVLLPVDQHGVLDLTVLERELSQSQGRTLVSVMVANNEIGVIQPISDISTLCRKYGALLHCDAVQTLGKIPLDFSSLGADMMTLSAHKCGGGMGAAALVVRRRLPLKALLNGGGQELGRRAGTENIPAIVGFAKAVEITSSASFAAQWRGWMDAFEQAVLSAGGTIFGLDVPRLPNTSCVAMPEISSEIQLMDFDLKGFAVSAGSACSSGKVEPSHVLSAMGVPLELAKCTIRVSCGWGSTSHEIKDFKDVWLERASRRVIAERVHNS